MAAALRRLCVSVERYGSSVRDRRVAPVTFLGRRMAMKANAVGGVASEVMQPKPINPDGEQRVLELYSPPPAPSPKTLDVGEGFTVLTRGGDAAVVPKSGIMALESRAAAVDQATKAKAAEDVCDVVRKALKDLGPEKALEALNEALRNFAEVVSVVAADKQSRQRAFRLKMTK